MSSSTNFQLYSNSVSACETVTFCGNMVGTRKVYANQVDKLATDLAESRLILNEYFGGDKVVCPYFDLDMKTETEPTSAVKNAYFADAIDDLYTMFVPIFGEEMKREEFDIKTSPFRFSGRNRWVTSDKGLRQYKYSLRVVVRGVAMKVQDIKRLINRQSLKHEWDTSVYKGSEQLLNMIMAFKTDVTDNAERLMPVYNKFELRDYFVQYKDGTEVFVELPPEPKSDRTKYEGGDADISILPMILSCYSQERCDDYESWIKVAFGVKQTWGDKAFDAWDKWSSKSEKYAGCNKSYSFWNGIRDREDGVKIGSLMHWAKEDNPVMYSELCSITKTPVLPAYAFLDDDDATPAKPIENAMPTIEDQVVIERKNRLTDDFPRIRKLKPVFDDITDDPDCDERTYAVLLKDVIDAEMGGGIVCVNEKENVYAIWDDKTKLWSYGPIKSKLMNIVSEQFDKVIKGIRRNIEPRLSMLNAKFNKDKDSMTDMEIHEIGTLTKKMKRLSAVRPNKSTTLENTLKYYKSMIFDDRFMNKLDKIPTMIPFKDVCYDFMKKKALKRTKKMYISKVLDYNMPRPTDKDFAENIAKVLELYEKWIPIKAEREVLQKICAFGIRGTKAKKHFLILTDDNAGTGQIGNNGKSKILQFMGMTFEFLHVPNNKTMLYDDSRKDVNSHSQCEMEYQGKRLAIFDELNKNRKISQQKVKTITGGDTEEMMRGCHATENTYLKWTILVAIGCNRGDFPETYSDDAIEALVRRAVIVPCRSTFVEKITDAHKDIPYVFEQEEDFTEKLQSLKAAHMYLMMTEWQDMYQKEGLSDAVMPQTCIEWKEKFFQDADPVRQAAKEWVDDNIEFGVTAQQVVNGKAWIKRADICKDISRDIAGMRGVASALIKNAVDAVMLSHGEAYRFQNDTKYHGQRVQRAYIGAVHNANLVEAGEWMGE
jgi:hypothetical protein